MFQCRVCSSKAESKRFLAREMMFGTREEFEYVECADCRSAQIAMIPPPEGIARHYPADYFSFNKHSEQKLKARFKRVLASIRNQHVLNKPNLLGALLAKLRAPPPLFDLFKRVGVRPSASILDVGCGDGAILDELASAGFRNLLGADPLIQREMVTPNGVKIQRTTLENVLGQFDIVMFNHSLEHVPDPIETLKAAHTKLRPGGICIVRSTTTSSEAWDRYGKDWIQLDPPRHFVAPSRSGMAIMGQRSGFVLEQTIDDSYGFQFWGSEQYQCDIPLIRDGHSEPLFSKRKLAECERMASEANASSRGDQAIFLFRRGS